MEPILLSTDRDRPIDRPMESMAANDETLGQEDTVTSSDQNVSFQNQAFMRSRSTSGTSGSAQSSTSQSKPRLDRRQSYYTPYMEDKLCRKLKFFFMAPHEKIIARKKCPWKLIIQVLKIILVTAQLIQFGYSRSSFVEFTERTTIAMQHMYLKDWTNSYETMPYPAAIGKYALYTIDDIESHINNAMEKYDQTEKFAIASLRFERYGNGTAKRMDMCVKQYKSGHINDTSNTYNIDATVVRKCYEVGPTSNGSYNVAEYFKEEHNKTLDNDFFDRLLLLELKFTLKSFRLELKQRKFPPQLYKIDVTISLDDSNKDGQMLVTLTTIFSEIDVQGHFLDEDSEKEERAGLVVFDSFIVVITFLSIVLCSRSVCRALHLRKKTMVFFKQRFGKDLSFSDRMEFINFWYVTIIINDVLTLVGTGYKIQLETRNLKSSSSNYDICGLMLGTGSLLAWMGVLRYIGFFNQFNILIITLKKAFPNMLRFLTCCIMLYFGFVICGWVVLGPYHIKFRQMSTASECLFSLINGDDMFVTFSATITDNQWIWYYSRIYLYVFISLFIYAVLNLFIAVIMDTYETIKDYYENGFPKGELFQFIDKCQDPAHSSIYRREDTSCNPMDVFCCCKRKNADHPNEHTSLIQ